jgi:hypothetical protein
LDFYGNPSLMLGTPGAKRHGMGSKQLVWFLSAVSIVAHAQPASVTWSELVPTTARAAIEEWGIALKTDGTSVCVGGTRHVAIFQRDSDGAWRQTSEVLSPGSPGDARWGWTCGVDGDRLFIGAWGEDADRGAVYTYHRDGSAWVFDQRLFDR